MLLLRQQKVFVYGVLNKMEVNVATQKKVLKEEAEDRTKIYNGMSLEEKLKLIRSRRGKSEKETKRILKQTKEKDSEEKPEG